MTLIWAAFRTRHYTTLSLRIPRKKMHQYWESTCHHSHLPRRTFVWMTVWLQNQTNTKLSSRLELLWTPSFSMKSHGQRRLIGYSPWRRKESDTTEQLLLHFSLSLNNFYSFVLDSFPFSSLVQSCMTLCKPLDCSLPGSSIHETSQDIGKNTGVACYFIL